MEGNTGDFHIGPEKELDKYIYHHAGTPKARSKIYQTMKMSSYILRSHVFIKLHITAQSGPVIYSFYATVCNPPGGYLS